MRGIIYEKGEETGHAAIDFPYAMVDRARCGLGAGGGVQGGGVADGRGGATGDGSVSAWPHGGGTGLVAGWEVAGVGELGSNLARVGCGERARDRADQIARGGFGGDDFAGWVGGGERVHEARRDRLGSEDGEGGSANR